MNNRIHNPEYAEKVSKMKARLSSLAKQYEDTEALGYLDIGSEQSK